MSPRLTWVIGTSMHAWMPLHSAWPCSYQSVATKEESSEQGYFVSSTTGLVIGSGNDVSTSTGMIHLRGLRSVAHSAHLRSLRSASRHPSGRPCFSEYLKVVIEREYCFTAATVRNLFVKSKKNCVAFVWITTLTQITCASRHGEDLRSPRR